MFRYQKKCVTQKRNEHPKMDKETESLCILFWGVLCCGSIISYIKDNCIMLGRKIILLLPLFGN